MSNFERLLEKVISNKLNPALWSGTNPKESVRQSLLKIANEFLNNLKIDLEPKDVILTGSCANYNWHAESDIDLHLVIDYKKIKNIEKEVLADYLYDASMLWNDHLKDIRINGFPVEIYALHDAEEEVPYSAGIYSLLNKKWVHEPVLMSDPSSKEVSIKAKPWVARINKLIKKSKENSDKEKLVSELKQVLKDLKKYRAKGLTSKGEHSVENMVFKNLKKNGTIGDLIDTSRSVYAKSLSLSEDRLILTEMETWE